MGMNQQSSETMAAINRFRDERHWRPYHNEKDLGISIAIEAAELMEIYQWRTPEEANSQDLEHIKEEVAEVAPAAEVAEAAPVAPVAAPVA